MRFFLPIEQELRVRRVVERDDLERQPLIDYHPPQEQLDRLGHVEPEPVQDVLARVFNFRRDAGLKHRAADNACHFRSIPHGFPQHPIATYWNSNTVQR